MRGRRRCRLHGGVPNIGRHLTEDAQHSRSLAKATAAAWLQPHANNGRPGGLVRTATATRLPNGRFAPDQGLRPRSDQIVSKAYAQVLGMARKPMSNLSAARATGTAVAQRPWGELSKADKLSYATDLGLDVVKKILELGVDPANPRVLGHVKDTALAIVGLQVKVDQERLRASRAGDGGSGGQRRSRSGRRLCG